LGGALEAAQFAGTPHTREAEQFGGIGYSSAGHAHGVIDEVLFELGCRPAEGLVQTDDDCG
jgi:hypothetical protein